MQWTLDGEIQWSQLLFHKLVILILEDFCWRLGVIEQLIDLFYLLSLHCFFSLNAAQQTGRRQQLYSVSETKQEIGNTQYTHIHIFIVNLFIVEDSLMGENPTSALLQYTVLSVTLYMLVSVT